LSATGAENVAIRDAVREDAVAACRVLRESIAHLCVADHRNDPAILNAWLANKTPETVTAWAVQKGNSLLLAVEGDAVLAVGSVTDAGEITLNYVAPVARFRGISRALLGALEARAAERGNKRCKLTSTATAHRFYQSAGYVDDGVPTGKFGTRAGCPMSKEIVTSR
jgi:GNAT superfamily N-acetyltransferase